LQKKWTHGEILLHHYCLPFVKGVALVLRPAVVRGRGICFTSSHLLQPRRIAGLHFIMNKTRSIISIKWTKWTHGEIPLCNTILSLSRNEIKSSPDRLGFYFVWDLSGKRKLFSPLSLKYNFSNIFPIHLIFGIQNLKINLVFLYIL